MPEPNPTNSSGHPRFHLRRIGPPATRVGVADIMDFHRVTYMIGRNVNQVDYLIDSSNYIHSAYISRCHARVVRQEGNRHRLFDDSLNGIFVNNIKIQGSVILKEGDRVTFGHPKGVQLRVGQRMRQPDSEYQFMFEQCTCETSDDSRLQNASSEFRVPTTPAPTSSPCDSGGRSSRRRSPPQTLTTEDVRNLRQAWDASQSQTSTTESASVETLYNRRETVEAANSAETSPHTHRPRSPTLSFTSEDVLQLKQAWETSQSETSDVESAPGPVDIAAQDNRPETVDSTTNHSETSSVTASPHTHRPRSPTLSFTSEDVKQLRQAWDASQPAESTSSGNVAQDTSVKTVESSATTVETSEDGRRISIEDEVMETETTETVERNTDTEADATRASLERIDIALLPNSGIADGEEEQAGDAMNANTDERVVQDVMDTTTVAIGNEEIGLHIQDEEQQIEGGVDASIIEELDSDIQSRGSADMELKETEVVDFPMTFNTIDETDSQNNGDKLDSAWRQQTDVESTSSSRTGETVSQNNGDKFDSTQRKQTDIIDTTAATNADETDSQDKRDKLNSTERKQADIRDSVDATSCETDSQNLDLASTEQEQTEDTTGSAFSPPKTTWTFSHAIGEEIAERDHSIDSNMTTSEANITQSCGNAVTSAEPGDPDTNESTATTVVNGNVSQISDSESASKNQQHFGVVDPSSSLAPVLNLMSSDSCSTEIVSDSVTKADSITCGSGSDNVGVSNWTSAGTATGQDSSLDVTEVSGEGSSQEDRDLELKDDDMSSQSNKESESSKSVSCSLGSSSLSDENGKIGMVSGDENLDSVSTERSLDFESSDSSQKLVACASIGSSERNQSEVDLAGASSSIEYLPESEDLGLVASHSSSELSEEPSGRSKLSSGQSLKNTEISCDSEDAVIQSRSSDRLDDTSEDITEEDDMEVDDYGEAEEDIVDESAANFNSSAVVFDTRQESVRSDSTIKDVCQQAGSPKVSPRKDTAVQTCFRDGPSPTKDAVMQTSPLNRDCGKITSVPCQVQEHHLHTDATEEIFDGTDGFDVETLNGNGEQVSKILLHNKEINEVSDSRTEIESVSGPKAIVNNTGTVEKDRKKEGVTRIVQEAVVVAEDKEDCKTDREDKSLAEPQTFEGCTKKIEETTEDKSDKRLNAGKEDESYEKLLKSTDSQVGEEEDNQSLNMCKTVAPVTIYEGDTEKKRNLGEVVSDVHCQIQSNVATGEETEDVEINGSQEDKIEETNIGGNLKKHTDFADSSAVGMDKEQTEEGQSGANDEGAFESSEEILDEEEKTNGEMDEVDAENRGSDALNTKTMDGQLHCCSEDDISKCGTVMNNVAETHQETANSDALHAGNMSNILEREHYTEAKVDEDQVLCKPIEVHVDTTQKDGLTETVFSEEDGLRETVVMGVSGREEDMEGKTDKETNLQLAATYGQGKETKYEDKSVGKTINKDAALCKIQSEERLEKYRGEHRVQTDDVHKYQRSSHEMQEEWGKNTEEEETSQHDELNQMIVDVNGRQKKQELAESENNMDIMIRDEGPEEGINIPSVEQVHECIVGEETCEEFKKTDEVEGQVDEVEDNVGKINLMDAAADVEGREEKDDIHTVQTNRIDEKKENENNQDDGEKELMNSEADGVNKGQAIFQVTLDEEEQLKKVNNVDEGCENQIAQGNEGSAPVRAVESSGHTCMHSTDDGNKMQRDLDVIREEDMWEKSAEENPVQTMSMPSEADELNEDQKDVAVGKEQMDFAIEKMNHVTQDHRIGNEAQDLVIQMSAETIDDGSAMLKDNSALSKEGQVDCQVEDGCAKSSEEDQIEEMITEKDEEQTDGDEQTYIEVGRTDGHAHDRLCQKKELTNTSSGGSDEGLTDDKFRDRNKEEVETSDEKTKQNPSNIEDIKTSESNVVEDGEVTSVAEQTEQADYEGSEVIDNTSGEGTDLNCDLHDTNKDLTSNADETVKYNVEQVRTAEACGDQIGQETYAANSDLEEERLKVQDNVEEVRNENLNCGDQKNTEDNDNAAGGTSSDNDNNEAGNSGTKVESASQESVDMYTETMTHLESLQSLVRESLNEEMGRNEQDEAQTARDLPAADLVKSSSENVDKQSCMKEEKGDRQSLDEKVVCLDKIGDASSAADVSTVVDSGKEIDWDTEKSALAAEIDESDEATSNADKESEVSEMMNVVERSLTLATPVKQAVCDEREQGRFPAALFVSETVADSKFGEGNVNGSKGSYNRELSQTSETCPQTTSLSKTCNCVKSEGNSTTDVECKSSLVTEEVDTLVTEKVGTEVSGELSGEEIHHVSPDLVTRTDSEEEMTGKILSVEHRHTCTSYGESLKNTPGASSLTAAIYSSVDVENRGFPEEKGNNCTQDGETKLPDAAVTSKSSDAGQFVKERIEDQSTSCSDDHPNNRRRKRKHPVDEEGNKGSQSKRLCGRVSPTVTTHESPELNLFRRTVSRFFKLREQYMKARHLDRTSVKKQTIGHIVRRFFSRVTRPKSSYSLASETGSQTLMVGAGSTFQSVGKRYSERNEISSSEVDEGNISLTETSNRILGEGVDTSESIVSKVEIPVSPDKGTSQDLGTEAVSCNVINEIASAQGAGHSVVLENQSSSDNADVEMTDFAADHQVEEATSSYSTTNEADETKSCQIDMDTENENQISYNRTVDTPLLEKTDSDRNEHLIPKNTNSCENLETSDSSRSRKEMHQSESPVISPQPDVLSEVDGTCEKTDDGKAVPHLEVPCAGTSVDDDENTTISTDDNLGENRDAGTKSTRRPFKEISSFSNNLANRGNESVEEKEQVSKKPADMAVLNYYFKVTPLSIEPPVLLPQSMSCESLKADDTLSSNLNLDPPVLTPHHKSMNMKDLNGNDLQKVLDVRSDSCKKSEEPFLNKESSNSNKGGKENIETISKETEVPNKSQIPTVESLDSFGPSENLLQQSQESSLGEEHCNSSDSSCDSVYPPDPTVELIYSKTGDISNCSETLNKASQIKEAELESETVKDNIEVDHLLTDGASIGCSSSNSTLGSNMTLLSLGSVYSAVEDVDATESIVPKDEDQGKSKEEKNVDIDNGCFEQGRSGEVVEDVQSLNESDRKGIESQYGQSMSCGEENVQPLKHRGHPVCDEISMVLEESQSLLQMGGQETKTHSSAHSEVEDFSEVNKLAASDFDHLKTVSDCSSSTTPAEESCSGFGSGSDADCAKGMNHLEVARVGSHSSGVENAVHTDVCRTAGPEIQDITPGSELTSHCNEKDKLTTVLSLDKTFSVSPDTDMSAPLKSRNNAEVLGGTDSQSLDHLGRNQVAGGYMAQEEAGEKQIDDLDVARIVTDEQQNGDDIAKEEDKLQGSLNKRIESTSELLKCQSRADSRTSSSESRLTTGSDIGSLGSDLVLVSKDVSQLSAEERAGLGAESMEDIFVSPEGVGDDVDSDGADVDAHSNYSVSTLGMNETNPPEEEDLGVTEIVWDKGSSQGSQASVRDANLQDKEMADSNMKTAQDFNDQRKLVVPVGNADHLVSGQERDGETFPDDNHLADSRCLHENVCVDSSRLKIPSVEGGSTDIQSTLEKPSDEIEDENETICTEQFEGENGISSESSLTKGLQNNEEQDKTSLIGSQVYDIQLRLRDSSEVVEGSTCTSGNNTATDDPEEDNFPSLPSLDVSYNELTSTQASQAMSPVFPRLSSQQRAAQISVPPNNDGLNGSGLGFDDDDDDFSPPEVDFSYLDGKDESADGNVNDDDKCEESRQNVSLSNDERGDEQPDVHEDQDVGAEMEGDEDRGAYDVEDNFGDKETDDETAGNTSQTSEDSDGNETAAYSDDTDAGDVMEDYGEETEEDDDEDGNDDELDTGYGDSKGGDHSDTVSEGEEEEDAGVVGHEATDEEADDTDAVVDAGEKPLDTESDTEETAGCTNTNSTVQDVVRNNAVTSASSALDESDEYFQPPTKKRKGSSPESTSVHSLDRHKSSKSRPKRRLPDIDEEIESSVNKRHKSGEQSPSHCDSGDDLFHTPAGPSLEEESFCSTQQVLGTQMDTDNISDSQIPQYERKLEIKVEDTTNTSAARKIREILAKLKAKKQNRDMQSNSQSSSSSSQDMVGELPPPGRTQRNLLPVEETAQKVNLCIQRCKSVITNLNVTFQSQSVLQEKLLTERVRQWREDLAKVEERLELPRTVIAVVGASGEGKSSLLNALLEHRSVLPTSGLRACTAAVVEVVDNNDSKTMYKAEIEYLHPEEWFEELKILVSDLSDSDGKIKKNPPDQNSELYVSYLKVMAVYRKVDKLDKLKKIERVSRRLGTKEIVTAQNPEQFRRRVEQFIQTQDPSKGSQLWPIVKRVRLMLPNCEACSSGAVLVDLPGVRDSNAARDRIAKEYMKNCTTVWVVSSIHRAITSKTAKELLGESFKRQLYMDGQYGSIAFICTKTDCISTTETINELDLRDQCSEMRNKVKNLEKERKRELNKVQSCEKIIRNMRKEKDKLMADYQEDEAGLLEASRLLQTEVIDVDSEEIKTREDLAELQQELREKLQQIEMKQEDIETQKEDKKEANREVLKIEKKIAEERRKMAAMCARERNKYSKKEIKKDFKSGLREMKRKAGLVDEEDAEEEEEEEDTDDEEVGSAVENLRVFCCSATDYQKLQNIVQDGAAQVFDDIADTEIPALRGYIHQMTTRRSEHGLERLVRSLGRFVFDLQSYIYDEGTSNERVRDRVKVAFGAGLKSFEDSLTGVVSDLNSGFDEAFTGQIQSKLNLGVGSANTGARPTSDKWGDKPRKDPDNKRAGGLAWVTYRATVRNRGQFSSPAYGPIDFNQELSEPVYRSIMVIWNRVFSITLPDTLKKAKDEMLLKLEEFTSTVQQELEGLGVQRERISRVRLQFQGSADIKLTEMVDQLKDFITNRQRDINRVITPHVQERMKNTYYTCASESGNGCLARMKSHMACGVDNNKPIMFDEAASTIMQDLISLQREVVDTVQVMCSMLCQDLKLAFEPLWDTRATSEILRSTFWEYINKACAAVRAIYRQAGLSNTEEKAPVPSSISSTEHPSSIQSCPGTSNIDAVHQDQEPFVTVTGPSLPPDRSLLHNQKSSGQQQTSIKKEGVGPDSEGTPQTITKHMSQFLEGERQKLASLVAGSQDPGGSGHVTASRKQTTYSSPSTSSPSTMQGYNVTPQRNLPQQSGIHTDYINQFLNYAQNLVSSNSPTVSVLYSRQNGQKQQSSYQGPQDLNKPASCAALKEETSQKRKRQLSREEKVKQVPTTSNWSPKSGRRIRVSQEHRQPLPSYNASSSLFSQQQVIVKQEPGESSPENRQRPKRFRIRDLGTVDLTITSDEESDQEGNT